MKKQLLLMSMLTILCGLIGCRVQTVEYESLGVTRFEERIADASVILLDVRTPNEYLDGHLPNAVNIDVAEDSFNQMTLAQLPKNKTIAVYCRSGKRSKKAADILSSNNYQVIELNTGIMGWKEAGKKLTKEEVDAFFTSKGTAIYIYCIKHGSIKMRIGDKWLYIDPVADKIKPCTDYTTMPKADYILVTHEHYDHLDTKAIEQLTTEKTIMISNSQSYEILGNKGVVMKNGDVLSLADGIEIKALPAYNIAADKLQFHPKGRDNGYLLTIEGLCIYISGDTEDISEMQELKNVEVAFLPCNLPYTMTPEQMANATRIIKPKVLFPYHYGQTNIKQMVDLLKNDKVDVRIRQYR